MNDLGANLMKNGEPWIDSYKFDKAVADRATVEIKHIGKVSNDKIDDKRTV